jgi:hypothetical protein
MSKQDKTRVLGAHTCRRERVTRRRHAGLRKPALHLVTDVDQQIG